MFQFQVQQVFQKSLLNYLVQQNILLSNHQLQPIYLNCYLQSYFRHAECTIEAFESFPKQTQRNRCEIFTSNGLLRLSVPVSKINGSKTLTKDIDIDFSKKWQNEHWRAIQSAYAAVPYFEDYQYSVKDIIYNSPTKLIDLNLEILNFVFNILDENVATQFSSSYAREHELDFRNIDFMKRTKINSYQQVFSYDQAFISNLSFLDLLFNEGPFMRNWILKK